MTHLHFHREGFRARHGTKTGRLSDKAIQQRLRRLMTSDYLEKYHFGVGRHHCVGFFLRPRAALSFPDIKKWLPENPPDDLDAQRAWVRAEIWNAVAATGGKLQVDGGARRGTFLKIANGAELPSGMDWMWTLGADRSLKIVAVVVDDGKSDPAQLVAAVPRISERHRTRVLVRPLDDGTRWSCSKRRWTPGRRFRALEEAVELCKHTKLVETEKLAGVGAIRTSD
ncbi:MAG: hypothetical protein AAFQ77_03045 [Myxococcota bacterium]